MKKIGLKTFWILLISFFLQTHLFSQTIVEDSKHNFNSNDSEFRFSIGPALFFHLRDKDQEDPNIPDEFEFLEERPSIATFYDNNFGLKTDFLYSFTDKTLELNFLLGVQYEFHYLNSSVSSINTILGERLYLHMATPYIGMANHHYNHKLTSYVKLGPSIRNYYGRSNDNGYEIRNNYKSTIGLRFDGGVSFNNVSKKTPLYLNINIGMDIGTIIREDVEFFKGGSRIGYAEITGADSMRDFIISVSYEVGYRF